MTTCPPHSHARRPEIDDLDFGILDYQLHLVLRNRTGLAAKWCDWQVCRSWLMLRPG